MEILTSWRWFVGRFVAGVAPCAVVRVVLVGLLMSVFSVAAGTGAAPELPATEQKSATARKRLWKVLESFGKRKNAISRFEREMAFSAGNFFSVSR